MRVGTLSTERKGKRQVLSNSARRECIADVVGKFRPDLLVCAGDALSSSADLYTLSRDQRIKRSRTTIVVEVANENKKGKNTFKGRLYALLPGGSIKPLGQQIFGKSCQVQGNGTDAKYLRKRFEAELAKRTFEVEGKTALVLCCGEINILHGRDKVVCQSPKCREEIFCADIIINPTHDRMGNAGTLLAKRKFLSRKVGGRKRLYVSSSNWNTEPLGNGGVQKRTARTLHNYFLSERELKLKNPNKNPQYEYRQAHIEFWVFVESSG